jgi:hypothetical protein
MQDDRQTPGWIVVLIFFAILIGIAKFADLTGCHSANNGLWEEDVSSQYGI